MKMIAKQKTGDRAMSALTSTVVMAAIMAVVSGCASKPVQKTAVKPPLSAQPATPVAKPEALPLPKVEPKLDPKVDLRPSTPPLASTTMTQPKLMVSTLPAVMPSTLSNPNTQTDQRIYTDHQGYKAQQEAIKKLNDTGKHPVKSYSLAKAQCWLDVSLHEYSRNDRSSFPEQAMQESVKITNYLKSGGEVGAPENPAHKTPLVNKAAKLRDDLWLEANQFKAQPGIECVAKQVACAEVELVHAGNEHNQQGWRHAKPYVQIAEDLIGEAQSAQKSCQPQPPVMASPMVPPPAVQSIAPAATVEKIALSASALFRFNKRNPGDLLAEGKAQLDDLAAKLKSGYASVEAIDLVGYTDRLGSAAYNAQLSLDRAATVKAYLQSQGVKAPMTTQGRGPADPVKMCSGNKPTPALTQCLQPNRRVEISIKGVKR
jgi:OmpA-OmpF porin, OOP family